MSHLTASPWHKPSPYEFPRATFPLSPPETDPDYMGLPKPGSLTGEHSFTDFVHPPSGPEIPASRIRKVSTLAYHHSGVQGARDNSAQRTSRALIVVIPPPTFSQERGQLGHSCSLGPRGRVSQGILMPLFPTIYGQLTAIAREFNFPSTSGLCLYLHVTEDGSTMIPRISDEAWQLLWAHLSEPSSLTSQRIPVSGRIEFDIDLDKARWYGAWVASTHKVGADSGVPIAASYTASVGHGRAESRTTAAEDHDDRLDGPPVCQMPRMTHADRQLPRKLSLVDRLDNSIKLGHSKPFRSTFSPPNSEQRALHLPPIKPKDEPKRSRLALRKRVDSWRATSSASPPSPGITTQAILEPVNMTGPFPRDTGSELNMDEYTWSISSAGPPDDTVNSPVSDIHLPSVHLAQRMVEDAPFSPSVATSWGPQSYAESAVSMDRPPCAELRQHEVLSRAVTPSKTTNWSPPACYSPRARDHDRSPDLVERCSDSPATLSSIATSWGPPLSYPPTPHVPLYIHSGDADQYSFDVTENSLLESMATPSPSQDAWKDMPWQHIWPYNVRSTEHAVQKTLHSHTLDVSLHLIPANLRTAYPQLTIYPVEYPHFDLYPVPTGEVESVKISPPVALPTVHPWLSLSPMVYPHFDLYPALRDATVESTGTALFTPELPHNAVTIKLQAVYPILEISYPWNLDEIYPSAISTDGSTALPSCCSDSARPDIPQAVRFKMGAYTPLCDRRRPSAGYPEFDIYPLETQQYVHNFEGNQDYELSGSTLYPSLCLYPAVYPHFDLYPAVAGRLDQAEPSFIKYHRETLEGYPTFHLYPPCNASNVGTSALPAMEQQTLPVSVRLRAGYPNMDLYTSVYPYIEPYPPQVLLLPEPEQLLTRKAHKDLHEITLADGVTCTPNGTETISGCSPTVLSAPVNEEQGLRFTQPLPKPTNAKSTPLKRSATDARLPPSARSVSHEAGHGPLSECTTEESFNFETSTRIVVRPSVLRRFSTVPASYSAPGRVHHEHLAAGLRPSADIGRSLPHLDGKVLGHTPTRSSQVPAGHPLQHMSESLGVDVLERSASLGKVAPTDKPPVRRRDSLVWQRAKAFDDKAKTELFDAPTRITLETLAKFPMPPNPSIPRAPQKLNRRRAPFA